MTEVRNRAIAALAEREDLTNDDVRHLSGDRVRQHRGDGGLEIYVSRGHLATLKVKLSPAQSEALLMWMEESRGWGSECPLFPGRDPTNPISRSGFEAALRRDRMEVSCA